MDGVRQSPATLATDLRALGLMRGSLVMVHASLRAIGPVEGGADGVIEAIRDALGEAGTMMMVLGHTTTTPGSTRGQRPSVPACLRVPTRSMRRSRLQTQR